MSAISSLQSWVVDTIYWSIFSVYVSAGALAGVAHGSVHGVQALAPRLTSVQGIKKLVSGEKAAHKSTAAGTHSRPRPPGSTCVYRFCHP